jgi:hypothetical protein
MYGLYGLAHNIENVYRLAAPFADGGEIQTTNDLKRPYLRFLRNLHTDLPINEDSQPVVNDPATARALTGAFAASQVNDLHQERMVADLYTGEALIERARIVRDRLAGLRDVNPEVAELFHLAIHSVLLAGSGANGEGRRAHGGSSNSCIGLIWLSLHSRLSGQDLIEMMVHELTHNLVFIEELNRGLFEYPVMTKIENWAQSSILKRRRPMDKVVHSIVVSTEILHARATYLPNAEPLSVHPESASMKQSTLAAIESVMEHPNRDNICRPRAIELVEKCREHVMTL